MRQAFITFRSHPTEKYLDEEFLTMVTPMCEKSIKYVISYEKQNTIDSHFHILIFFENVKFDITNLRSKFNTKSWKNWYLQIKEKHTVITPKFDEGALQLKLVEKTQEDYLKTLGYICKDNVYRSKQYDEQEITDAVKFYHIQSRKPPEVDNSWKILTTKTAHATIEQFCQKNEISLDDKTLPLQLAQNKISMINISEKQQDKLFTELCIGNSDYTNEFSEEYHKCNILEQTKWKGDSNYELFYRQKQLSKLIGWIKDQNIDCPILDEIGNPFDKF